ncbi:hypothetical protein [Lichenibacterium ramalinae]|uniref:Uncharacterized protein n=1 Tax=Lichenibacterium ramalinae TaxID=2316527 RepID=A0A4Q2RDL0_9HYPH|nr:hypothetical protein [Lichenibacterium ramalinae]RYB04433.1 hypothetical protein D3272_13415 [Lichenibacterium ramalinae]
MGASDGHFEVAAAVGPEASGLDEFASSLDFMSSTARQTLSLSASAAKDHRRRMTTPLKAIR